MDVRFVSRFGEAMARWASTTPVVHEAYDVELNVTGYIEWSRTEIVVGERVFSISMTPEGIRLCGAIDSVRDDGVVALRLGDSLVLLESIGEPPPVGSNVCITVNEVELYAYEI
jgi:hypothetical protein